MLYRYGFFLNRSPVQEFIYPLISTVATALITWFFTKRKNNAEAKLAEIDAEIKAGEFYRGMLDDAKDRLDDAFQMIKERDNIIKIQDEQNKQLKRQLKEVIDDIETLTTELKKYKQLNGKSHDIS